MKKILFTIMLLAATINSYASDFSAVCSTGQTLYYHILTNSTVEVTGYGGYTRPSGSLEIPDTVTSYNGNTYIVVGIGEWTFLSCPITSVIIPNTVTYIGQYAFSSCSQLSSVSLPNSLIHIYQDAFSFCTGLLTLNIPSSVTDIGNFAFYNCESLHSITIPGSVLSIGNAAFYNCDLDSLILEDGVVSIGGNAFESTNIRKLTIPRSVTWIGNNAFKDCSILDSLFFDYNGVSIGSSPFYGCSGLKYLYYNANNLIQPYTDGHNNMGFLTGVTELEEVEVGDSIQVIPDRFLSYRTHIKRVFLSSSVTQIGNAAFSGCSGLLSVYLPNNVSLIGDSAFYNCAELSNITYGNNLHSIGSHAFDGCSNLDSLYFGVGISSVGNMAFANCVGLKYLHYNNGYFPLNLRNGQGLFSESDSIQTLIIGDSVSVMPNDCINGRTYLDSVYIGSGVTLIGNRAFLGCSDLRVVVMSDHVSALGEKSFYGCSSLSNIRLSCVISEIPDSTFYDCYSLSNIMLPTAVTHIGARAFYNCSGIMNFTIPDGTTHIGEKAFYNCSGINALIIPNSVTYIGDAAFCNCSNMSNLHISTSLASVEDSTFYNCSSIGSITIPDGVVTIGNSAFKGCSAATTLSLGSGVMHIGKNAFGECDNIQVANINVPYIGKEAFSNCDRLVSVNLGDSVRTLSRGVFGGCFRLQNFTFGSGIDSIPSGVFSGCVRLENMQLNSAVRHIGDSAFYNCTLIHDIVLLEGLMSIGNYAFYGCSSISGMLEFPSTITKIGNNAFSCIGTVNQIRMNGAMPPTIFAYTFYSVGNSTPVEVPCGAILNYYTTNYWENFSNIVEAPPFRLNVTSNNATMGNAAVSQQPTCSNHSAIIQATAETGFHFIQWSDGNGTNPRTVNMTQDSTFTAIFVPNNSQVTVVPNDPLMGTTSGSGTYGYNAPVTMTATAYSGYHFLHWNDGNTQNPRYMAAVRDTSFTAIFVSNVSTITVGNANPDMGNVSGSGVYYYQNQVSITATPNYGYHFTQWNDGNTQNPRTITVSQDSAFTAFFALNTYNIVASSNSTTMGSVTGGGSYTYLHEMSMTATPAYGYHFVQWNDQNTDNPRTITVTRDSAFTAQFAANSYAITAEPNDPTMGSAYGSGTYNFNTTATLTAVAEYGYHFTQWSDGVTNNPRLVTVQNSATYTAQFEINSYILTVQSSNPAIGTTSGGGSYNYLTPVNITAIPNAGYHFTQWSDGNTDNPRLVNVIQNATYTAQFAINSYAVGVTCNNSNMGSVSGSGTYNHNSVATLSATAYYGYHFVQWQDGNTQNPRSVVVTDSTQYIAQFDYNSYLVTANSSNMTIGIATGGGSYNYLSQVALTAVPTPHYHFTMWNDSIEDNPRTITVTRDSVFTAHFAIDRHTIGVLSSDVTRGTASGTDTVDYNTAVWISATANYGYHFTQWNDGNTQNPRRVVVLQDTVFTASFAPNQYTAICNVNDASRGMAEITTAATPQAGAANYQGDYHSALTFTASPYYGYHFVQWNDGMTDNPRQVTLTKDTALTAYFDYNTYTIILSANDSTLGSVQGGGEYNYLSQVTITATAAHHCHFVQWNDGNTTNPRLLTLTGDSSFTAIFEQDQQFTINVIANDTARGSTEGSGTYFLGETATISATASDHYYFSQWSDGITSNPRTVTVMGDATYTAVFEPVSYILTVTANDYSWGSVSGGGTYPYGSVADIAAQPFDGYIFTGWSDGDSNATRQIVIEGDLSLEARFEKKNTERIGDLTDDGQPAVSVQCHTIIVTGAEGLSISVYDALGRKMAAIKRATAREELALSAAGIYIVKIENHKAIKCIYSR